MLHSFFHLLLCLLVLPLATEDLDESPLVAASIPSVHVGGLEGIAEHHLAEEHELLELLGVLGRVVEEDVDSVPDGVLLQLVQAHQLHRQVAHLVEITLQ